MRVKKYGALITLVVLAVVLAGAFVGRDLLARGQGAPAAEPAGATAEQEGASADEVVLLADHDATVYTDLDEPLTLSEIADGRPLVINFWATWCPYCVEEMPDFQQIYADYGDRVSFAFVDVADGRRETVDDAKAWLAEQGLDDLPAYYDTAMEASASFGAYALPTTVVVSAEGEVVSATAGRIDPTLLRGALNGLV